LPPLGRRESGEPAKCGRHLVGGQPAEDVGRQRDDLDAGRFDERSLRLRRVHVGERNAGRVVPDFVGPPA
jgi:hypothetical protein